MIGKTAKETSELIKEMPYKERLDFVIENKEALIEQKLESFKECDTIEIFTNSKAKAKGKAEKSIDKEIDLEEFLGDLEVIERTIVGNTCWVLDSHDDVHIDGCWEVTLEEDSKLFYHTKNHSRAVDDRVGKPVKTYVQQVSTETLGVQSDIPSVEALLMDTKIYKALDSKMFTQYALAMVNQHSVGMRYVSLKAAVNVPQREEEYKNWIETIDKIVNKERAIELGYYWIIEVCKLVEISAVTRGSNQVTPTLDDNKEEAEEVETTETAETKDKASTNFFSVKSEETKEGEGGNFFNII